MNSFDSSLKSVTITRDIKIAISATKKPRSVNPVERSCFYNKHQDEMFKKKFRLNTDV